MAMFSSGRILKSMPVCAECNKPIEGDEPFVKITISLEQVSSDPAFKHPDDPADQIYVETCSGEWVGNAHVKCIPPTLQLGPHADEVVKSLLP